MTTDLHQDPLAACSVQELRSLAEAARDIQRCHRVMAKTDETLFSLLGTAVEALSPWHHYPEGDVYDPEFHAQYYFHIHPLGPTAEEDFGHFHTFLRPFGMPDGVRPMLLPQDEPLDDPNDAVSHLVAVSVDRSGTPVRLFTTNRWVTGETWYPADDVVRMLDHFTIDLAQPSWLLNCWLTALIRLFKPQIIGLLHARDKAVRVFAGKQHWDSVLDDRDLEMTSSLRIAIPEQVALIDRHLRLHPRAL